MKTIGVIGLGSIGMRHANNLKAMGHNVRAWDPDMKRRLMFNGVLWEPEEIWHGGVDGVVIASPTPEHAKHLKIAIDYGLDIFIEKPIMDGLKLDAHELDRLDSICHTMVGYNLRFHSCVKKAKEWLDAGLIGKPLWSNFTLGQYSEKPPYLRDGCILNWSHEIDLALYLLGAATVTASSTRVTRGLRDPMTKISPEHDDMTDILLRHESGCMSTVHLDYITKPEIRKFTIVGTENSMTIDLVGRVASIPRNYGDSLPDFALCGTDTWNDNYIEEMQAFIDRIDGKETIGCTGEQGLEVLKICLEVRKQAGLE